MGQFNGNRKQGEQDSRLSEKVWFRRVGYLLEHEFRQLSNRQFLHGNEKRI
jgi:hypothetical protein